jgi:signal transduction histidine kinase
VQLLAEHMRREGAGGRDGWSQESGVRRLRESHAERYVYVFRPLVLLVVLAIVVVNSLLTPSRSSWVDYLTLALAGLVSLAAMLVYERQPPLRVAALSAAADMVLVFVYVLASAYPAHDAIIMVWPLIVLAYFASARAAFLASVVVAVGFGIASDLLDTWNDEAAVPAAVSGVLVAGALIAFLSEQGRRVEAALAEGLARDRVAFVLAQRIRMADDPRAAIEQIASVLGDATGAVQSLVLLLEVEDDFVADLATWHRADGASERAALGRDLLDSTLLHLIATGHGAVLEGGVVRLLRPVESAADTGSGSAAVDEAVFELFRSLDAGSGVVVPLQIAGRVVGAVVLAAGDGHAWSSSALPMLEQLAPQLAAGLAQAVLLRDQREALESLERVDRLRDRLIANVSHELRTPLTSTIGFVETLLRDDVELDPELRHELLEHARDGGLRLLALVEDLLALGSTRPESLDLDPVPLDAARLVQDAIRGIDVPASRLVVVEVEPDTRVVADRNRALQVVVNLVNNALHHGRGDVVVRVERTQASIVVDVIDDGPGIAPEHVSELFLPFASFSTRTDSTGLGLAISRAIVEAHGGTIDYCRIDGETRTRFRVRLPVDSTRG